VLREHTAILTIGAQSSLTGGATPMGEALLSTARLNALQTIGTDHVRVQAGVPLAVLDDVLRRVRHWLNCLETSGTAGAFSPSEFLFDSHYRDKCHLTLLSSIVEHRQENRQADARRLQTRADSGNRMTDAALYKLAALHTRESEPRLRESGDDPLIAA
jgi:hypothetical protein